MNRPLYAFGVLIAFLVLAIMAIGLSSRPKGQQPSAGASGMPRRQPGVTVYVVVLPEESPVTTLGEVLDFCASGSPQQGAICGLTGAASAHSLGCGPGSGIGSASGDVVIKPTLWSWGWSCTEEPKTSAGPQFVSIQSARPIPLEALETPLATGYDAAYDRAMAENVGANRASRSADAATATSGAQAEGGEELVLLFDSLVRSELRQRERKWNLRLFGGRRWDYEAQSIALGALNRLWQLAIATRLDDDWLAARDRAGIVCATQASSLPGPTWEDYTAWLRAKQWTVALRNGQIRTTALFWRQPPAEVLQFAVAGLNRVAELLLNLGAPWLNQAAERFAGRA